MMNKGEASDTYMSKYPKPELRTHSFPTKYPIMDLQRVRSSINACQSHIPGLGKFNCHLSWAEALWLLY